ncbi:hypothetical protein MRX96_049451 [Rhipicephalus microplus]
MRPLFYNANKPFAMLYGSEAAYRAGRRSRRDWPDDDRESRERLHEEMEAPSWDDEAFSRRSREPGQSTPCGEHHCRTKQPRRLFSAGGRHGNVPDGPSNIRLLGLTALAALLVVEVVATNAKTNHIILGSLDSEPPDATRQVSHGTTSRGRGEAGGNGAEPTAIADDVEESSRDADVTVNEYEDLTRRSGTPQTSTSFSGDESKRRETKPNCQAVVYTYCPVARREFHYQPSVNACLATALDPMVQLCARGFNREDVRESWWYFESDRCHPWRFPAGACPSNDSALFSTAAECVSRCGAHGSALCRRVPRATSCSRNQLRFPYFAHFSQPVGRVRCLRASAVLVEAAHRCLAGDNRFASLADCAEACAAKASGSDHRDQGT